MIIQNFTACRDNRCSISFYMFQSILDQFINKWGNASFCLKLNENLNDQ